MPKQMLDLSGEECILGKSFKLQVKCWLFSETFPDLHIALHYSVCAHARVQQPGFAMVTNTPAGSFLQ